MKGSCNSPTRPRPTGSTSQRVALLLGVRCSTGRSPCMYPQLISRFALDVFHLLAWGLHTLRNGGTLTRMVVFVLSFFRCCDPTSVHVLSLCCGNTLFLGAVLDSCHNLNALLQFRLPYPLWRMMCLYVFFAGLTGDTVFFKREYNLLIFCGLLFSQRTFDVRVAVAVPSENNADIHDHAVSIERFNNVLVHDHRVSVCRRK